MDGWEDIVTRVLIGDALIFTGKDYVTNSKYSVNYNQIIIVASTIRTVLVEVEVEEEN